MADAASRWALVTSLAVHVAAFGVTLGRPRAATQQATLSDFWAGTTFEVPELVGDVSLGAPAVDTVESANEFADDGVHRSRDLSSPSAGGQPSTNVDPPPTPPPPDPAGTTSPAAPGAKGKPPARHARSDARAAASAAAGQASPGSSGSASSGTFGGEGAAAGVRDLVRSFVRAIPLVASSDPVWSTLPLGAAGSAELTLGMNGEGKPFAAQPLDSAPAHLRRLVHKTLSVMAGGRFAPPPSDAPAAEQKLRIAIALTQQAPPADREVSSGGAFGLRFEPADAHHVSRAFFTLASGRQVEVSVRQMSVH